MAIIGSSGSGKTTLLRCLNFLERPDTGVIKVNGETMWDAADPATQRESEVRKKRLHFGLVSRIQPVPAVYGIAERDAGRGAAGQGAPGLQGQQKSHPRPAGAAGEGASWPRWACRSGRATTRISCPAASSSAWPLPGPWPCTRTSSASTSLPARWTRADRRGAARSAGPCRPQDHHDHRDPRDELCP